MLWDVSRQCVMFWDVMRQCVMLWDILRYCVMFWDAVRDCLMCWDIWPLMVRSLKCDVMRCFEKPCDVKCAEMSDLWWSGPWSVMLWDVLRYCVMLWDVLRPLNSDGQILEVWCYEMFWDTVWCCEMCWDIWPLMVGSLKCDVMRCFEILCDVVKCAEISDLWRSDPWSMVLWDVLRYCVMLWDVLRSFDLWWSDPWSMVMMFWDTVWCCEMCWDIWPLMVRSLKCSGRQRVVSSRLTHARWSSTFLYSIILVISLVLYKNKQSQL